MVFDLETKCLVWSSSWGYSGSSPKQQTVRKASAYFINETTQLKESFLRI
jgi:hypothetical protein